MIVMPPVFNAGDTIYFFFDTYNASGASVTITGLAVTDIEVYKNGSTTQRSSDSGYALLDTDGIDFDGTTGLHGFSIDTSDNTDSGFWADGNQYLVNVNAITVDGQTVSFSYLLVLGYLLRPTTAGRKLDVSTGGEAGVDWANVGSPTTTVNLSGTTVSAVSGAVGSVTGNVGGNVTGSVGSLGTTAKNDVNAEVDAALADINLDHLVKNAVDTNFATTVHLDSVIGQIADDGTSASFDRTTDSLEAIKDSGGGGPTAADIADAVWEEDITDHSGTTDSTAEALAAAAAGGGASAADIADAVWDEARGDHTGAGTFGQGVASVQGNVTGSVGSVTGAVGSVTGNVGGNVVGSVASVTGAVGSVTGNVGGNVVGSVGSITGNVGGNVVGSVGSLGTTAKNEVNAEVDAALADINLDHLVKNAVDTDFPTTVHLDSVIGHLADDGTSASFDRTTDSLEAQTDAEAAAGRRVRFQVHTETTNGDVCDLAAWLEEADGSVVPCTSGDTCAIAIVQHGSDSGSPQFEAETTDFGDANSDHRFEHQVATPGFDDDRAYYAIITLVIDSVTYTAVEPFNILP